MCDILQGVWTGELKVSNQVRAVTLKLSYRGGSTCEGTITGVDSETDNEVDGTKVTATTNQKKYSTEVNLDIQSNNSSCCRFVGYTSLENTIISGRLKSIVPTAEASDVWLPLYVCKMKLPPGPTTSSGTPGNQPHTTNPAQPSGTNSGSPSSGLINSFLGMFSQNQNHSQPQSHPQYQNSNPSHGLSIDVSSGVSVNYLTGEKHEIVSDAGGFLKHKCAVVTLGKCPNGFLEVKLLQKGLGKGSGTPIPLAMSFGYYDEGRKHALLHEVEDADVQGCELALSIGNDRKDHDQLYATSRGCFLRSTTGTSLGYLEVGTSVYFSTSQLKVFTGGKAYELDPNASASGRLLCLTLGVNGRVEVTFHSTLPFTMSASRLEIDNSAMNTNPHPHGGAQSHVSNLADNVGQMGFQQGNNDHNQHHNGSNVQQSSNYMPNGQGYVAPNQMPPAAPAGQTHNTNQQSQYYGGQGGNYPQSHPAPPHSDYNTAPGHPPSGHHQPQPAGHNQVNQVQQPSYPSMQNYEQGPAAHNQYPDQSATQNYSHGNTAPLSNYCEQPLPRDGQPGMQPYQQPSNGNFGQPPRGGQPGMQPDAHSQYRPHQQPSNAPPQSNYREQPLPRDGQPGMQQEAHAHNRPYEQPSNGNFRQPPHGGHTGMQHEGPVQERPHHAQAPSNASQWPNSYNQSAYVDYSQNAPHSAQQAPGTAHPSPSHPQPIPHGGGNGGGNRGGGGGRLDAGRGGYSYESESSLNNGANYRPRDDRGPVYHGGSAASMDTNDGGRGPPYKSNWEGVGSPNRTDQPHDHFNRGRGYEMPNSARGDQYTQPRENGGWNPDNHNYGRRDGENYLPQRPSTVNGNHPGMGTNNWDQYNHAGQSNTQYTLQGRRSPGSMYGGGETHYRGGREGGQWNARDDQRDHNRDGRGQFQGNAQCTTSGLGHNYGEYGARDGHHGNRPRSSGDMEGGYDDRSGPPVGMSWEEKQAFYARNGRR